MGHDALMDGRKPILEIKDLRKTYENTNLNVLNGIDLRLYEEDFLCVLGPSGCGKTTMIRCIAGFEAYEGSIVCNGAPVSGPGPDRIMVFQDFSQLFPWKTVLQNVMYPLNVNGMKEKRRRVEIAEKYLDIVGLLPYSSYYPHQLSGGMKQRAAIARGLALNPKLILMDEPFAALDAMTRNQMQTELLRIKEKAAMTVIFITHNIQESVTLGNRIVVLSRAGKIKAELDNLLEKPVTPATKGYGEIWTYLNSMLNADKGDELNA